MQHARTIYGHEQQLLRLDDLHQLADVVKDAHYHLLLCQLHFRLVCVGAVMNDAIHVEV